MYVTVAPANRVNSRHTDVVFTHAHTRLRSRYCTVEDLKLTTDVHKASRGLSATVGLLVGYAVCAALYGMLFPSESEAAFSNYHLWKSLGQVIAFGYSFYLCAAVKLYILTSTLVVGMLCYLAAEYLHRKTSGSSADGGVISNVVISCSTRETMCDKLVVLLLTM